MDRFFIGIDPAADQFTASLFDAHERSLRDCCSFEGSSITPLAAWLDRHGLARQEALVLSRTPASTRRRYSTACTKPVSA